LRKNTHHRVFSRKAKKVGEQRQPKHCQLTIFAKKVDILLEPPQTLQKQSFEKKCTPPRLLSQSEKKLVGEGNQSIVS
jgi:hypothetical protein